MKIFKIIVVVFILVGIMIFTYKMSVYQYNDQANSTIESETEFSSALEINGDQQVAKSSGSLRGGATRYTAPKTTKSSAQIAPKGDLRGGASTYR
jgi:hypothetical protein